MKLNYKGVPIEDVQAFCREHNCGPVEVVAEEKHFWWSPWVEVDRDIIPSIFMDAMRFTPDYRVRVVRVL